MIVQRRTPWDAFHPIAGLEFMPFRDAGRGRSDFNLSITDCLWGVWKAIQVRGNECLLRLALLTCAAVSAVLLGRTTRRYH